MCEHEETLTGLLKSLPHWEFEILLMILFDGLIMAIGWPFVRKHWQHHLERDRREAEEENGKTKPKNRTNTTITDLSEFRGYHYND